MSYGLEILRAAQKQPLKLHRLIKVELSPLSRIWRMPLVPPGAKSFQAVPAGVYE